MIQLRNNQTTHDKRLDRIKEFDERSRNYPVRAVVPTTSPRSYTWACKEYLDQGQEGACVGYSWTHAIDARPKPRNYQRDVAETVYNLAKRLDEYPGEDYEGSSVLGGAKAVNELNFLKQYRWAFGINDLILAVGHVGPAVLGINWYDSMFDVANNGFIKVGGEIAGGHAILCNGVNVKHKYFRLHNSWGDSWGKGGDCFISFDDMARLLSEEGEACIGLVK